MPRLPSIAAYPPFAAVLALCSLPVFLWLPTLYGKLGVGLGLIGLVLLGARLADAVLDPWIGRGCDQWRIGPRGVLAIAAPCLALSVAALFRPPAGVPVLPWLAGSLAAFTVAFSAASIAHTALAMAWGAGQADGTRLWTIREGFGLVGTLTATILPHVLGGEGHPEQGLALMAAGLLVAVPVLALPALWLPHDDRTVSQRGDAAEEPGGWRATLAPLADPVFRRLLGVFLVNGTASALPAATVVFYVKDRLGAGNLLPVFLILYMLAGAAGMPWWTRRAATTGHRRAWQEAILLATCAFVWATFLGEGQVLAYGAVCVAAGLALGAEVALPPAMVANGLTQGGRAHLAGRAFGLMGTAGKINLALASAISLPLLEFMGFVTGKANTTAALVTLGIVYAGLPCLLKLWAWQLLGKVGDGAQLTGPPAQAPEAR
ncbi:MAG: MFS transporter [Candidatus Sericytochromatia bacterium]|nr:MFS transporter [Candidatus Sericytochromatia bacterium]